MNDYYLATNLIDRAIQQCLETSFPSHAQKKTTIGILAKSSNDPDKSKIPTLPEKIAACWLAAMLFADGFTIR